MPLLDKDVIFKYYHFVINTYSHEQPLSCQQQKHKKNPRIGWEGVKQKIIKQFLYLKKTKQKNF